MEIIDALPLEPWSFGGGTALMLQLGHRKSYDIAVPLHLPYLNPRTQGFEPSLPRAAPLGRSTSQVPSSLSRAQSWASTSPQNPSNMTKSATRGIF